MKNIDFPAGHSTDTHWFAIDKDGNIGFFDATDEGSYPIQFESQTFWEEFFINYTIPISKGLKQLYLNENTINRLINRCNKKITNNIINDKYIIDGCIVLLNDNYSWNDLNFETYFSSEKEEFAILLSPTQPLFLISSTLDIKNIFIDAIKKNIISKVCGFTMFWDEGNKNHITVNELEIFLYVRNENNSSYYPYNRAYSAKIPLNILQLDHKNLHKIPIFQEFSFYKKKFIQPMEFFSCNFWNYSDETPPSWKEKGYIKVKINDTEWAYCLLPLSNILNQKMNLFSCNKCYNNNSYHLSHDSLESFNEYPSVIIVRNYLNFDYKEQSKYDHILNLISKYLFIDKYNDYLSHCVKCYNYNNKKNKEEFSKENLSHRFEKCHKHFEIEVETIQPLLLIAIENNTKELLEQHYEIQNYIKTPCLCSITINKKNHPLLIVNNVTDEKESFELTSYLTSISDTIQSIITKHHERSKPPRIIKIKE